MLKIDIMMILGFQLLLQILMLIYVNKNWILRSFESTKIFTIWGIISCILSIICFLEVFNDANLILATFIIKLLVDIFIVVYPMIQTYVYETKIYWFTVSNLIINLVLCIDQYLIFRKLYN